MRTKTALVLSFLSTILMSCARTGETYPYNYLDTGKFETNFYTEHKGVKAEQVSSTINLDLSESNGSFAKHWKPFADSQKEINGIKAEDQMKNGSYLDWFEDEDSEIGYGPNKCLGRIKNSFKEGILSRLYDGRVRCDGKTYARTRIQINQNGYSCYFPGEINTAKYLAIALRGSTNLESTTSAVNLATLDLQISLFQKQENSKFREIKINFKDAQVCTNTHGKTELLSFYFDKAFEVNGIENYEQYLNGISAMSIQYNLKALPDAVEGEQFGLMLYEFMLPESTWR